MNCLLYDIALTSLKAHKREIGGKTLATAIKPGVNGFKRPDYVCGMVARSHHCQSP
jgi:hypothetical protein